MGNELMNDLEKAIVIAVNAHRGQLDKQDLPYVLHPLRVMLKQKVPDARVAAVLHDVVEDTDVTLEELAEAGFSAKALEAIRLLTHIKSVPYLDYVKAVAANPIARQVKLADLEDNLDPSRILNKTAKDLARLEKYREAKVILEGWESE